MALTPIGLSWNIIVPTGDKWECCICIIDEDIKIVLVSEADPGNRFCCHTGHNTFGLEERITLIRDTLLHYQYLKANWRKHVVCWLEGICHRIIIGDY
jgi:hypothetical protein